MIAALDRQSLESSAREFDDQYLLRRLASLCDCDKTKIAGNGNGFARCALRRSMKLKILSEFGAMAQVEVCDTKIRVLAPLYPTPSILSRL